MRSARLIFTAMLATCGTLFAQEKPLPSTKHLELKRVILATNSDPFYKDLWAVVAPLWKEMGLQPTLALIADETCAIDTSLGDVIRFSPIPGVSEAFQTQAIRLILPALYPDDGCLISDIDMLPISRAYFFDGATRCAENSFLVYRDKNGRPEDRQYPMCYVAAKGSVYASIFGVHSPEDFSILLQQWHDLGYGWFTDQLILYHAVNQWEARGGSVTRLGHVGGPRLDRASWDAQLQNLRIAKYIDCHCPRPYSEYKASIDQVAEAIRTLWKRQGKITP